ncbi:MAG: Undecaprenyl-phosphate mannosyltransferase [Gammaproteobacteria bacterium]|jgi:dolichol-phosphate mannosyltransferase|nr:Undecaprenyl-phosphate mannosyltransferase [Gammaproteobacteria bacterium]
MDTAGSKNFSIVIPTFHEARNIPELVKRIAHIDFGTRIFEVILMDDDSQDGIEEIVETLQGQYAWLKLIIRKGKKGLSESVLEGFEQANYPVWIVMDADLSHPPEKIPEMLAALAQSQVDLVIGSRYIHGGSSDEMWPIVRRALSHLAAFVARIVIGLSINDPLSGFLALKRETFYAGAKLEPIGWKIGLEIMVKCRCKQIQEIPIHFTQRTQGASKLSLKVIINYLRHLSRLIKFKISSA